MSAAAAVDPVTVQILRNRIGSVMDEMHHHFFRSGYSTIVRESRDFSCVILDAAGRLLVAPPMFFHATAYRYLVERILALYGADAMADGDAFICNHPYDGALPHIPDMGVIAPVVHGGRLIGFSGAIAHKADIGGAVPGSNFGQATETFQEGIAFPPVRLWRAGKYNADLERLIAANSRQPALFLGDLRSQTAACAIGRDRMKGLADDLGAARMEAALAAMIEGGGRAFAAALAQLPPGTQRAEAAIESDGVDRDRRLRLAVTVTVADGAIAFDFTDSDDQARGTANLRPALVEACCFQALIGTMDPTLPYSDAARAHVAIRLRPGSLLDPAPPAPCSSYMKVCMTVIDMLIEALGPFVPARAAAWAGGSGGGLTIDWRGEGGAARPNQYEIFGSAYGGTAGGDGASGVTVHLSNIHVTPIEIVETEFPCRVTRFELIPGSGGDGEHRGGLALRRDYALLEPAQVIFRGDRARTPPRGVAGGRPGRPARFVVNPGRADEREMPISCRVDLPAGATLRIEAAGGGGWGDPVRRKAAARADDRLDGYVVGD